MATRIQHTLTYDLISTRVRIVWQQLAYEMMIMKLKPIPTFSYGDNVGTIQVNLQRSIEADLWI